ncbi:MAG: T9SS type A sorting domain-containing protein [Bacteroidales bacterium]|nr:T9SS type A sorting domain-containing protein [Bacteroidales bacterium]
MRRVLFFLFFFFLFTSVTFAQRVLFVGNSYTAVNDLPAMVSSIAGMMGESLMYETSAPGGCTFQGHLTQSAQYIQQGGWDVVVLQEQSQLPSFPYNQFMNESYPYAQQLCQMIRQYNPEARIVFYMTWGRKNGDSQNAQYYPVLGTYAGMDSLLRARYMQMAQDNHAQVSPVGAVWHHIRNHYPQIELYQSDESHPSLYGTYAAACCFYTVLYHKDPMEIQYTPEIDAQYADLIRQSAKAVAYDSLNTWLFIEEPDTTQTSDTVGVEYFTIPEITLYPNPTQEWLFVETTAQNEINNIRIFTVEGIEVSSIRLVTGNKTKVDVRNLPSGIYLLEIVRRDGNRFVKQFVKSR